MHHARNVFRSLATVVVALSVGAQAGHAAIYGSSVTLFPWAGYANFAKNVNLEDKPIFGLSLGIKPFRYVGIEGHVGRTSTESTTGFGPTTPPTLPATLTPQDVDVLHYGVNLLVHFRPSAWVSPYVMAGWQEGRWEYDNQDSVPKARYENGWEVGGGIVFHLNSRIGIRVRLRARGRVRGTACFRIQAVIRGRIPGVLLGWRIPVVVSQPVVPVAEPGEVAPPEQQRHGDDSQSHCGPIAHFTA